MRHTFFVVYKLCAVYNDIVARNDLQTRMNGCKQPFVVSGVHVSLVSLSGVSSEIPSLDLPLVHIVSVQ